MKKKVLSYMRELREKKFSLQVVHFVMLRHEWAL